VSALRERNDVNDYVDSHGWKTVAVGTSELFLANGLVLEQEDDRAPFAHRQLHHHHTAGAYVSAAMLIAKFGDTAHEPAHYRQPVHGSDDHKPIPTTRGARDDQPSR
jgi:hypothetical protein